MDTIYLIIQLTLMGSVPILITSLGGLVAERSGVTNICLEGLMVGGAFGASMVLIPIAQNKSVTIPAQLLVILGLVVGALIGGLLAYIHAFASIKAKANQTISATAINLFIPATAVFIQRIVYDDAMNMAFIKTSQTTQISKVPFLGDIPVIGDIFFQKSYLSFYIAITVAVFIYFLVFQTKWGKALRACGENPHAADAAGINIYKMRYKAVIISGALAGFGGVSFMISTSLSFNPEAGVGGLGFLALAVLIFGNWKVWRVVLVSIFFGLVSTIAHSSSVIPFLAKMNLPSQLLSTIPYIVTLLVLIFTSKNSHAPKAVGQIYDQGQR
jgi:simple sugar transport system permease protein